jgi:hypothetical protein
MEARTTHILFGQNGTISVRMLLLGVAWFAVVVGVLGMSILGGLSVAFGGSIIIVCTAIYAYLNEGFVICVVFAVVTASPLFVWNFLWTLPIGYSSLFRPLIGFGMQAVGAGLVLGAFGFVLGSGLRRLTDRVST